MVEHMEELNLVLSELRKKLAYIVVLFLTGATVSFPFTGYIIERIRSDLLPDGASIVYVTPLEVIMLKLKMTLILALLLVLPLVVYLVVKMIFARFNFETTIKISRTWMLATFVGAIILFFIGASYAYFGMLPLFIKYLFLNAEASGAIATYSIFKFVSFVVTATIIFGLIFEMPLLMLFLIRNQIVPYKSFVQHRKHMYVVFLLVGALITPPDVISQVLVGLPLVVFFELSLLIVRIIERKKYVRVETACIDAA
ncbi:preprotein translocase subunit TatC [Methanococcoides orientis]|uniref:twin-arginine translocase subunit TatC n=1 Tax=Methanococcoides orientis TaxID=2822137 RepID=UPI001E43C523|nr:twin-arginine translocase subunit TatC [Methanococcoides orientis]UGV41722.1 preprotein translocase subunit TatC [Methanococcoides orientis]